jgi:hypothetical protein
VGHRPNKNTAILLKAGWAKGGHRWDGEGKRRKLKKWMWLMYSLHKNEYTNFKPVEVA